MALLFFSCSSPSGNLRLNIIILISSRTSIQDFEHLNTAVGISALRCQSHLHSRRNTCPWLEGAEDGSTQITLQCLYSSSVVRTLFLRTGKSQFRLLSTSTPIALMFCTQMPLPGGGSLIQCCTRNASTFIGTD